MEKQSAITQPEKEAVPVKSLLGSDLFEHVIDSLTPYFP
jgi:hypothetical protein